jgi:hypothetical protein
MHLSLTRNWQLLLQTLQRAGCALPPQNIVFSGAKMNKFPLNLNSISGNGQLAIGIVNGGGRNESAAATARERITAICRRSRRAFTVFTHEG